MPLRRAAATQFPAVDRATPIVVATVCVGAAWPTALDRFARS